MSKPLTDAEYANMMRNDLAALAERCFNHLSPGTPYLENWHIDLIAAKLEAVADGRIKRLIVNVPPRSLKSVLASVAFPAWLLGLNPGMQIICACYGQDLSAKLALDCRSVMMSEWYTRIFGVRLEGARPAIADLKTTLGGGRFATSVGGVLTGRGGDVIIIDDPLKPDEAVSDAARNAANDWISGTVMSRLNDKKTGAIVIIMQRLHLDDVVGHVQEHGDWEVLSLPAIAEVEERHVIDSIFRARVVVRHVGEALHPERESLEVLAQLRKTLGEYNFSGQYQQAPVPLGGGMVKAAWLRYCEPHEWPQMFDQVVQSWDTANKESQLSDYSVCTTWGIKGDLKYLINVRRERMGYPLLKRAVMEQVDLFKPQVVLVEDKASGTQLIQELRQMGLSKVKEIKPLGDKVMRMHAQTAAFEGGFVRLPRNAAWLDAYVVELTTFPMARHDDQVDSTAQALAWIVEFGREPGLIAYYREECQRLQAGG